MIAHDVSGFTDKDMCPEVVERGYESIDSCMNSCRVRTGFGLPNLQTHDILANIWEHHFVTLQDSFLSGLIIDGVPRGAPR